MMSARKKTTLVSALYAVACLTVAVTGTSASAAVSGVTPPTGPTYTKTVFSNIVVTGDHITQGYNEYYQPPECWMQPYFYASQSYVQGDPRSGTPQTAPDADSYWWDVAALYPGLVGAIAHMPDARQEINQDFQAVQNGMNGPGGPRITPKYVWWAPNWLSGSAGWACAEGLIGSLNMNNGFLNLEPPQQPGAGTTGDITNQDLAALARAALRLPAVTVNTIPGGQSNPHSAVVNAPTTVYVTYGSNPQPQDRATVVFDGAGYLWAQITTSPPKVAISTNDPGATVSANSACTAKSGPQSCTVTFATPTAATPFTVTATVTWTVSWATSTGQTGTFTTPPAVVVATHNDFVREIQAVNNG